MDEIARRRPTRPGRTTTRDRASQFDQFEASSLFCPRCKRAVPVRKRLLLVLPDGERYEYLCAFCSSSIGRKVEEVKTKIQLITTP
ncbi:MAG: cytoplasmic protein [bacterium]